MTQETLRGDRMTQAPKTIITNCRACGSDRLEKVVDLGQDFFISCFPKVPTLSMGKAPLELLRCFHCTLVQLRHTVSQDWLYRDYWYLSGTNESMVHNLESVVRTGLNWVKPDNQDVVLDIGANDGTLLQNYRRLAPSAMRAAFEPAVNLQEKLQNRGNPAFLANDYFPPRTEEGMSVWDAVWGRTAIVTTIAMFYDLPDPTGFVKAIREILKPSGVWILELSYLPTMIGQTAFDAICHEHLEYYSISSMTPMLGACGLRIVGAELNAVNGGSIRLVVARTDGPHEAGDKTLSFLAGLALAEKSLDDAETYAKFKARCERTRHEVRKIVQEELDKGGVVDVYGASTKGNTLLQYCGLDHTYCRWAIDRARDKWGLYTVGTSIPVVSEETGREDPASMWIVPIWHFREAVISREAKFLNDGGKMLFPLPTPEVVVG